MYPGKEKQDGTHTHCSLVPPTFLSAFGALHTTMLGLHIKPQQHVFPDFVFVPFIRITMLPSLNLLSQQHALLWLLICYHCFSLIGIFVWLCFSFCKRIALSSVCHYSPPPPTVVLAIFLLLDFCCHNNYNSKVSHSLLCDVWVVVSSGLVRTLSVHTTVWYKCVLQHERCGGTYNKIKQPLRMTTDFMMRLRRHEGGVVYNQTYDSRRRPPVKQIKPTNILIKLFVFGWFLAH